MCFCLAVSPLPPNIWVTNQTVAWTEWRYYYFTVSPGQGFVVRVVETSPTGICDLTKWIVCFSGRFGLLQLTSWAGDVDLYLRKDQYPNLLQYDYKDVSVNKNFSLTVGPQPGNTTRLWYAGLFGFRQTTYNIRLEFTGRYRYTRNHNHNNNHQNHIITHTSLVIHWQFSLLNLICIQ